MKVSTPTSRLVAVLLTSVAMLAVTSEAAAGGFFIPGHGVRALGRGGAAAVGVWDLNALWYNPALLGGIEGNLFMLDATLVNQSVFFQRDPRSYDSGEIVSFAPVENEAAPLPIPQLGFASNFGTDKFVFAFGAFAPNASSAKYPETGAQRYTIIDSEGSVFLALELAAAYKVNDWIWVGAGVQNWIATLRLINMVSGYPGPIGDPEDEDLDILLQTDMASFFTPSGNLGVFLEPAKGLQFGLGVQLPILVSDSSAKVKQRLPSHALFDQAEIKGDTVKGEFYWPLIARAGLRYDGGGYDVELNVVHERWSSHDAIRTTPMGVEVENVPGVGTIPVGALNIPREFEDSWALRLGGDYEVIEKTLTLRAGAALEQSAIPTKTLSVLTVDMDKLFIGVGGTVALGDDLDLDLGYGHVFYQSEDVKDSEVRQLNPTNSEGTTVVGNGRYEASADLVGVGLRVGF